jgi:hypothetical protein
MKKIAFASAWLSGEVRQIDGYPTGIPGLLIVPPQPDTPGARFTVVHARSGCRVASKFESPEAALAAANQLAEMAVWTKTGTEMREYVLQPGWGRSLLDIAARFGGWASPCTRLITEPIDNGVIA